VRTCAIEAHFELLIGFLEPVLEDRPEKQEPLLEISGRGSSCALRLSGVAVFARN